MNIPESEVIASEWDIPENSEPALLRFFAPLKAAGLGLKSATVDGNPQVIKILKQLWPEIIIQRCLVHVQRQGLMWCRRYPKRRDTQELRDIFLKVTNIDTYKERDAFLSGVRAWEEHYGSSLARASEKAWVQSDVRRARSMLLKALPNMFHYLDDGAIAFTTNALEGYFSRLKDHYFSHRGLAKHRRANYFHWYLFLKSK